MQCLLSEGHYRPLSQEQCPRASVPIVSLDALHISGVRIPYTAYLGRTFLCFQVYIHGLSDNVFARPNAARRGRADSLCDVVRLPDDLDLRTDEHDINGRVLY